MNSFNFTDAFSFNWPPSRRIPRQKSMWSWGYSVGVLLRWVYSIAVDVIRNNAPWCFGSWVTILIRLAVALGATFFVFSGYWQKVKDQPASMRFWNALEYGITMDVIVSTWLPSTC